MDPTCQGHADRAVTEGPAFHGEPEDVRHKHRRNLSFVDLVYLKGPAEPSHRTARRCLGFTDDQRQTAIEKDYIETLLDRAGLVAGLFAIQDK